MLIPKTYKDPHNYYVHAILMIFFIGDFHKDNYVLLLQFSVKEIEHMGGTTMACRDGWMDHFTWT